MADPAGNVHHLDAERIRRAIDDAEVLETSQTGNPDTALVDRECAEFPLTDLGNAERFRRRNRDDFKWCSTIGWLAWDGSRWSADASEGLVAKAVHLTIQAIAREADEVRGSDADIVVGFKNGMPVRRSDKLRAWCHSSQSAAHIAAVARLAAPYFEIDSAKLDADPMKINVLNGTFEVRKSDDGYVEFRAHDRQDLITKIAPVYFDEDATCPAYDAFLARVQPEEAVRRTLHQYAGLALTAITSEQTVQFWWGKGKNGKSTLIDTWCFVAGEYARTAQIETFLDHGRSRRGGDATPDIAMLPGVRLLRTSEPERGAKLAESLIKLMTGGEPMQARRLNRDPFEFTPTFKAIISGNYRPEIHGTDDGIWRRVMLVPWTVKIPEEERDRDLPTKLRAESSGILNRLLDGLCDYLDNGLLWPQEIAEATEAYRSDSDPLGRFISVCTKEEPDGAVQSSHLHEVFVAWATASGEKAWSAQGFGRAIRERFKTKKSSVTWVLGLALIKNVSDFVDQDGRPLRKAHAAAVAEEEQNVIYE